MKLKTRIRECEQQIQNLKTLPYYTVFNRKGEQERDIKELEEKLTKLQIILNAEL